jgi:hypothetical protein
MIADGALMTLDKLRMVKLSRNALLAAFVLGVQWEVMLCKFSQTILQ